MNITTRLARAREILAELPEVPAGLVNAETAAAAARVAYHAARQEHRDAVIRHDTERSAASMAALEAAQAALDDADASHRAARGLQQAARTRHAGFLAAHVTPALPIADAALHELTDGLDAIAGKLTLLRDLAARHDVVAPRLIAAGPTIASMVRQLRGAIP